MGSSEPVEPRLSRPALIGAIWAPLFFLSLDVDGKTLGIAGLGRIGRNFGQKAAAFGMNIIYTDVGPDAEFENMKPILTSLLSPMSIPGLPSQVLKFRNQRAKATSRRDAR